MDEVTEVTATAGTAATAATATAGTATAETVVASVTAAIGIAASEIEVVNAIGEIVVVLIEMKGQEMRVTWWQLEIFLFLVYPGFYGQNVFFGDLLKDDASTTPQAGTPGVDSRDSRAQEAQRERRSRTPDGLPRWGERKTPSTDM